MMAMATKNSEKEVYVDKDGRVRVFAHAEEWEERALLGFLACTTKGQKAAFAPKLKNGHSGRARTLTHKQKELSATRLLELIVSGDDGPEIAVREVRLSAS